MGRKRLLERNRRKRREDPNRRQQHHHHSEREVKRRRLPEEGEGRAVQVSHDEENVAKNGHLSSDTDDNAQPGSSERPEEIHGENSTRHKATHAHESKAATIRASSAECEREGEIELPESLIDFYTAEMRKHQFVEEGSAAGENNEEEEGGSCGDGLGEEDNDDYGVGAKECEVPQRIFHMPDEGIFYKGIPFHHFTLTALNKKHLRRLRKHVYESIHSGVEISRRKFDAAEDEQIYSNWHSFAHYYNIPEEEAPLYMGAATAFAQNEETGRENEHARRLKFSREVNFRPWMCKRLLNRSCVQVFRRCYLLFRDASEVDTAGFMRSWSNEEDEKLLAMVSTQGRRWEKIGGELKRSRYSCLKRYLQLLKSKNGSSSKNSHLPHGGASNRAETSRGSEEDAEEETMVDEEWDEVEIARLYSYLSDHMSRNPVLVATIPEYAKYEERVNWADPEFNLSSRSEKQRKKKWEELKQRFQRARATLQTDIISEVERHVFSEPQHIVALARVVRKQMPVTPPQLAKCVELMLEQAPLESLRHLDRRAFAERLAASKCLEVPAGVTNPAKRIIRRVYFLLYVMEFGGFFTPLPIGKDTFEVKLHFLVSLMKKTASLRVRRGLIKKCMLRFIRKQGWRPRVPVEQPADGEHGDADGNEDADDGQGGDAFL